jgi:hypothetical protein
MIGLDLHIVNLEANSRNQQKTARLSDIERYNHSRRKVLLLLFCRLCLAGVISIYRKAGFATDLYIRVLTLLFLFLFPRLKLAS